jgi:ATP-binding cassette, subfamily B, bacterial
VQSLNSEFTIAGRHQFDRRGPVRWIWSHLRRHPLILVGFLAGSAVMVALNSMVPTLTGRAFDVVLGDEADRAGGLAVVSLVLLAIVLGRGVIDVLR